MHACLRPGSGDRLSQASTALKTELRKMCHIDRARTEENECIMYVCNEMYGKGMHHVHMPINVEQAYQPKTM
jgi:hypothetical protein